MRVFKNREEAGKLLAELLKTYNFNKEKTLILAIPRGGVPVAKEVSKVLNIPFSLVITKKLAPLKEPEAAFGAIAPNGIYYIDEDLMRYMGVDEEELEAIKEKATAEVKRRVEKYLQNKEPDIKGKDVIIIDDGIATGYTAMVAGMYAKSKGANKVYLAIPVCPVDSIARAKKVFDEVICLYPVETPFFAVGSYYQDFHQLSDEEMFRIINN